MTLKNESGTFLLGVADIEVLGYLSKKFHENQSKKMEIIITSLHCN